MKAAKGLLDEITYNNTRRVKRALAAGAAVDGVPDDVRLPLLRAATLGRVGIIDVLLEKGANIDIAVPRDVLTEEGFSFPRGTRALHAAACAQEVDALRALLLAGAQPNVKNSCGCTALMLACDGRRPFQRSLTMVEMLLEAGANPSLASVVGRIALHSAAHGGADNLIQVLAVAAPGTLNHADEDGLTPLSAAAEEGHESTVRLLLSAGASDRESGTQNRESSIRKATRNGHGRVVAVLLDAGLEAVGGADVFRAALRQALSSGRPRILDMLLGIEGDTLRTQLANSDTPDGLPILLAASCGCFLTATSVLLAAGADERACFSCGLTESEIVGGTRDEDDRDEAKEAALGRMLKRGPAFRARSYCWPVSTTTVVAGESPSRGKAKHHIPLGVRIFRPTSRTFFVSRIAR